MQQLKVFNFEQNEVRLIEHENENWFIASDIARVLNFTDAEAMTRHLDADEKQNLQLVGFKRGAIIINEPGLYGVILKSRKEEAKNFKRWITHEVIPSIRKYGAYMTPETIEQALLNPDTIIQLATTLKEERAKRMAAEILIQKQKPKVLFADAVQTSQTSILVGQLAKLITQNGFEIGQNRLFSWMRENGYLGKKGAHYNEPTQYAVERGWFEVIERTVNEPNGSVRITRTTKVTGKGQIYFINKFLRRNEEGA